MECEKEIKVEGLKDELDKYVNAYTGGSKEGERQKDGRNVLDSRNGPIYRNGLPEWTLICVAQYF